MPVKLDKKRSYLTTQEDSDYLDAVAWIKNVSASFIDRAGALNYWGARSTEISTNPRGTEEKIARAKEHIAQIKEQK